MFIAMNRFKVPKGSDQAFEKLWLSGAPRRQSRFEAWTRSESFRTAHARAGSNKPLYLDHPEFEGFNVLQEVRASGAST